MKKDKQAEKIAQWAEGQEIPLISDILPSVAHIDLPPKMRRVLAVKCLPNSITLSQKQKSEIAGVTTRYWYHCEHDERFKKACVDYVKSCTGKVIPEIWAVYLKNALKGNMIACEKILAEGDIFTRSEDKTLNINITDKRQDNLKKGLDQLNVDIPDRRIDDTQPN